MSDWPTPHLIYGESALREAYESLRGFHVLYALKACYRPCVLRTLRALGAGAEVMTEMEYDLARSAGFEEIVVNGLGRSEAFLQRAASDGALIVVDCLQELERIPSSARLGARVKLDLGEFPDKLYACDSKLGLTQGELENLGRPLELLHVHVASQETDVDYFRWVYQSLAAVRDRLGFQARLDLGGGWEVFPSDLPERVTVEPGRYLTNRAGRLVTSVVSVKPPYLILDAGTSTMMPHKEASYRVVVPASGDIEVVLVDGITSLTSVLGKARLAHMPEAGERLELTECGAYTSALAQFWAYPPIPVIFERADGVMAWDLSPQTLRECRRLLLGA